MCLYIYIHTHTRNVILLSNTEEQIVPFASTCMELEDTMLGEISQAEKDKYHIISLICGI